MNHMCFQTTLQNLIICFQAIHKQQSMIIVASIAAVPGRLLKAKTSTDIQVIRGYVYMSEHLITTTLQASNLFSSI